MKRYRVTRPPEAALYRYSGPSDEGDPSIPYWGEMATFCYFRLWLGHQEEAALLWWWGGGCRSCMGN